MVNQLPQGWKEEELGKHANIKRGNTITKKQVVHGDYPVVAGGKGAAYYHNEYNRQPPVITVSGSGASAGYVNYWEVPIFASDCSTIEEKDLNIKYIYYFLKSRQQELLDKQVGVAIPHVSPKDVSPLLIPYPIDKGEQDYIVKTLDAVTEIIRLRKETIQLAKELIPTIFQEMFGDPITNPKGWNKKDLGQVCDVRDGTHASPKFYPEGYPLITSKNLIDGEIDFSNVSFISEKDYEEINKRSFVDDGDILLAMIGTIGNPVIVKRNRDFAIKNIALIKFYKKDSEVTNTYIKSVLELVTDNLKLQSIGVTQKFISLGFLRKYSIPIPPITMQEEFADKVEQINKYIAAQQEELEQFETLFQSLLQEAFTGVLTWNYPRKECHDKKDK